MRQPGSDRWWTDPSRVDQLAAGVFEGGGAKGIAYGGALEAVLEARCWFDAVAGASAGAITALLVAAGLRPEEIRKLTVRALAALDRGRLKSLNSLTDGKGYFPLVELGRLLAGVLGGWRPGGEDDSPGKEAGRTGFEVTFETLFERTGIELDVVCADISRHNLVVFSPHDTPGCQVVPAVLASASIPFAFESLDLTVPDAEGRPWLHTLVDGGVSANFPLFIFRDGAFRRYSKRPRPKPRRRILGFLLKAEAGGGEAGGGEGAGDRQRYRQAAFKAPTEARAWEDRHRIAAAAAPKEPVGQQLLSGLFWLPGQVGRLLNLVGGPKSPLRWPARRRWQRGFLATFDGTLGFFHAPLLALGGLVLVLRALARVISEEFDQLFLRPPPAGDAMDIVWDVALGYLVPALYIVALPILAVVLVLSLVANWVLLVPLRRLTHGLVRTYVAGTGALPWLEEVPGVIPLTVPAGLTTLSFQPPEELRQETLRRAHDDTAEALREILPRWAGEEETARRGRTFG